MPDSSKPPSKKAVIEWFRAKEIPRRAGFDQNKNAIATWFHGIYHSLINITNMRVNEKPCCFTQYVLL